MNESVDILRANIEVVIDRQSERGESLLKMITEASPEQLRLWQATLRSPYQLVRDTGYFKPVRLPWANVSECKLKRVSGNPMAYYGFIWSGVPVNDRGVALFDDPLHVELTLMVPKQQGELLDVFSSTRNPTTTVDVVDTITAFLQEEEKDDVDVFEVQARAFGRLARLPFPRQDETWMDYAKRVPTGETELKVTHDPAFFYVVDPRDEGCCLSIRKTAKLKQLMTELCHPSRQPSRVQSRWVSPESIGWKSWF